MNLSRSQRIKNGGRLNPGFCLSAGGWPAQSLRGKAIKKALGRTSGPRSWDRRLSLRSVVAPQGFFNYFARVFLGKVYLVSSGYVPVAQKSNKYFEEKPVVVDDPFGWKGLSTVINLIGCCDKNSVNYSFPIHQQDTFSMIGKKSQASDPTFFHLSFRAIFWRVFYEMLDIKIKNSYGDYLWFFDNLADAAPAHHPRLLHSFLSLDQ